MSSSLQLRRPNNSDGASHPIGPDTNSRRNATTAAATAASRRPTKRNRQTSPVLLFALTLVFLWLLTPFYLAQRGALQHDTASLSFFQIHTTNSIAAASEEVIDMRELSYSLAFDNPDGGAWKQGWDVDPKSLPLTVFVVPHSHCDPGWIKTFDDYFQSQTRHILDTVIAALLKDPRRKFIWAEISYFSWWWEEQPETIRQATKVLLQNGQLEFVTGGWVQPDEANTELFAMEIQLQEGHDFIETHLGPEFIPKYGWSIDPFGYSPTMAYLLQKYGFRAMLIQRVHYAVKKELAKRKHLEFLWRQTWDETGEHDIFAHVMPFYSYDVPHTCGPDPAVCCQFDFARIAGYGGCPWRIPPQAITPENVESRAMLLLDQYQKKATLYRSNVVIAPLGDDFRWISADEAEAQYENYQKMFDYLNTNVPGVNIQFGTLSEYFDAVMGTFEVPILKGSFFTYADRNEDYWSGYFTSRVFDKALDRKLERVLYAATSLGATKLELQKPRRALSLFQHHDGVTGTAKNNVVEDYAKRMHEAIHDVQDWIVAKIKPDEADSFEACWQSDAPRGLSENLCGNTGSVYLYNPLETPQFCGEVEVQGHSMEMASLPCEVPGAISSSIKVRFDSKTGLMTHPIQEQWMLWKVREGGAYLFVPGVLRSYGESDLSIENGGFVVSTPNWKRKVVQRGLTDEFGVKSTVFDFIFETNLQNANEEWFVRFSSNIENEGIFHTDLNGFNFDTHRFRKDMPIQSQVFPMPTLASIEDDHLRMSILSEHAQGTASLENGSIDVWLDRRLVQDDGRGLFQGVADNVPTRTRLRVVLESEGYSTEGEFLITPLCRRMWDELNHPLEMFGSRKYVSAVDAQAGSDELTGKKVSEESFENTEDGYDYNLPVVPFVYMVYNRVDYLERAITSLMESDFKQARVPLIVSHDGNVPEMIQFVETLSSKYDIETIQIIHPYSCFEHPDTFPGNDEKLNIGYHGDHAGNKRTGWVTCCKHHFTWMLKTVFEMDYGKLNPDGFFFMEEDYLVAPTIFETIVSGLNLYHEVSKRDDEGFFGITLDPTDGFAKSVGLARKEGWRVTRFVTGPMVLTPQIWTKIRDNAVEFCTFDEYNWDWSIAHLQGRKLLPHRVLTPTVMQVMHFGTEGMHGKDIKKAKLNKITKALPPGPFHGTELVSEILTAPRKLHEGGFGGWGHPADHNHCIAVLTGKKR